MAQTGFELLERVRGIADGRGRVVRAQLLELLGQRSLASETRLWLESKGLTVVEEAVVADEPVAAPLTLYLKEVGAHRLLAAHEERDLARTLDERRIERSAAVFRWARARAELVEQAGARDSDPSDFVEVEGGDVAAVRRRLQRMRRSDVDPAKIAALRWRESVVAPWAAELRYRYRLVQREEGRIRQTCLLLGGMSAQAWSRYALRALESEDWIERAEVNGELNAIDRDAVRATIAEAQANARSTLGSLGLTLDELRGIDRDIRASEHEARRARNTLIRSNLRLVVSIARRSQHRGVALDDLIQEGNIGLMRAIDKFDWRLGYKLSTYATWWIRQAVTRVIQNTGRTVRLPGQVVDEVRKLAAVTERLLHDSGEEPSVARLAKEMNLDVARIRELQALAPGATSLDEEGEDGWTRHSALADENALAPEELHELDSARNAIELALTRLNPEAATVVRLRYGLGTGEHSVVDIARQLNVSRARVRGIEQEALTRLKDQLGEIDDWL